MKVQIKLKDHKSCSGCLLLRETAYKVDQGKVVEPYEPVSWRCGLYGVTMSNTVRSKECIEDNGY